MSKQITFLIGALGVIAGVLDKFSDTFAGYPTISKFLPVAIAITLALVAYYNLYWNPDGTHASEAYKPKGKDDENNEE